MTVSQDKRKLQAVTLGCSKNRVDTEHILSALGNLYEIVPDGEDIPVDVLLLNTCGFIGDAKEESVQAVLEAVEKKKNGYAGKVVVFGCLSKRYADELP
ncbi:MAG: 30S ribosomal protein S12 methylthiotransferase RimO, partial [Bacteroidales bacterium]|nr:30S ribosomal protein S12 methylthiotransferase RimO [Bacteroidales bacterium]